VAVDRLHGWTLIGIAPLVGREGGSEPDLAGPAGAVHVGRAGHARAPDGVRGLRGAAGTDRPNFGLLTDVMVTTSGSETSGDLVPPGIEPEIALPFARPLSPVGRRHPRALLWLFSDKLWRVFPRDKHAS
jgi:hypothetical protein